MEQFPKNPSNNVVDMKNYTNDGSKILIVIKEKYIDKYYKERSICPTRVIKSELLPNDAVIRVMYTELLGSYYCGFFGAALSVGNELLEYLTKKKYSEIKKSRYPTQKWEQIIRELKKVFEKSNRKSQLLNIVEEVRKKYRNSQSHGNLFQLIDDCRVGDVDLWTGKITKRKYTEEEIANPNGLGNISKIVIQRQNAAGGEVIAIVNRAIVEFFILND